MLQKGIQRFASSRFGAWIFSRTLHHFDRAFLMVTGGRTTLTAIMTGLPVVMLFSTGAKSGLLRASPLLGIPDKNIPDSFAIVASNWGGRHYPAWYFNLKANPRAAFSAAGERRECLAHEAVGEEYERFWQRASETYMGFPLYKKRAGGRRIPIIVLTPV